MHVTRRTNQELVVLDSSIWVSVFLLCASLFAAYRLSIQHNTRGFLSLGFMLLFILLFWRKEVVVFDAARQQALDLLADYAVVDLIHMDVQGQELPVVRASIELIDSRVKYFHIGTHSREIETELRQIFGSHHWTCRADFPGNREHHTPFGTIVLEDGIQSWSNPKFCSG